MEIKCPDCGIYYPDKNLNCPHCETKIKDTPVISNKQNIQIIENNQLKQCRSCAMMIPLKAKVCPHCQKGQGIPPKFAAIVIILFTIFIFYIGINSKTTSTIIDPNNVTDDQIYREFEVCMNTAKKEIGDNKLEGRKIASSCMGLLQKYGPERGKKAFNLYFNLD